MLELLSHDTNIWVAISFVIFLFIAVKFAGKAVTGGLDNKIAEIKSEIETAERLKQEAAAMLADIQQKQRDAEKTAADIIEQAKKSAILIQNQAEFDLNETMERREAQLADRLGRLEEKAISEIQNHAADLAMKATRELVEKTLDDNNNAKLVDQTISSVGKYLN